MSEPVGPPGGERADTGSEPVGPPGGERADTGSERKTISTGRNLPAAIAVGVALGALVIVTLLTVKVTFLVLVAAIVAVALWEFRRALAARQISILVIPIAAGGALAFGLAYWQGPRDALAALALAFVAVLAWRLPGGAGGYLRDVAAGTLVLAYLPGLASFVALMLAQHDGAHRCLLFAILAVCSDSGGYFAGILFGKHPMAPSISPKKTWEGLAGSAVFGLAAGALGMTLLLPGALWQGLVLGAAAVAAATLGDLVESMIKRDLDTKDMGSILPGHGGVLDRIDAMLVVAPVAWLLMTVFLPAGH
ncbi:MAG TPA: phosphatidate cytidylyltransferase [Streptosporangiaceae bacterium]|nr:phosphatidate cytidylyltransferase [Streptosporangiaceae bacterium]